MSGENERTGCFAVLLQALAQPGVFRQRLGQQDRGSGKPREARSQHCVLAPLGRRKVVGLLVSCDRGVEIVNADDDLGDAGPLGSCGLAAREGAIGARCEVVNQEREESAIRRPDLRGFPIQRDAVGTLASTAMRTLDRDAGLAQARDLALKIRRPDGPGARGAVDSKNLCQ